MASFNLQPGRLRFMRRLGSSFEAVATMPDIRREGLTEEQVAQLAGIMRQLSGSPVHEARFTQSSIVAS